MKGVIDDARPVSDSSQPQPGAEHRAGLAVLLFQVAAKVAVGFKVIALMEQVNWQIGRLRR